MSFGSKLSLEPLGIFREQHHATNFLTILLRLNLIFMDFIALLPNRLSEQCLRGALLMLVRPVMVFHKLDYQPTYVTLHVEWVDFQQQPRLKCRPPKP